MRPRRGSGSLEREPGECNSTSRYALTKYVAGIQPDRFGYKTWVIEPAYVGMGVDAVNASVKTPHGPLSVSWTTKDSVVTVDIDAPAGTSGKLVLSMGWTNSGGSIDQHERQFCPED